MDETAISRIEQKLEHLYRRQGYIYSAAMMAAIVAATLLLRDEISRALGVSSFTSTGLTISALAAICYPAAKRFDKN